MNKSSTYETLIKLLIFERQKIGFTQFEIAKKLGKPQSFVSKYEIGERRLDVGEFVLVCQAIGVNPLTILEQSINES